MPVDAVIDELWGEAPPRQAQHAVQVYVSELRRALAPLAGGDVITWRAPGYVLVADPEAIDAQRFERLVAEGTRRAGDDDATAAATLREALALWRGEPLADFAYEEFAQPAIRHLEGVRLQALEALARLELTHGRDAEALALAEEARPPRAPTRGSPPRAERPGSAAHLESPTSGRPAARGRPTRPAAPTAWCRRPCGPAPPVAGGL